VENNLPPFIARDGQLLATPPIEMSTTLYLFLLDADWDRLRALVDRYLNLGGPTVYRPLLPMVMLYCSYARSRPLSDPIGWCPEKDFGFWVPVAAGRLDNGVFVAERALVFTPYLWVDSGVAMVGGREVYGFPKQLGTLTMPAAPSDPATFTIDTLVIPREGPDAECTERRILEVARLDADGWEELRTLWQSGAHLLGAFGEILARFATGRGELPVLDPAFLLGLIGQIGRQLPMVFLKQFPDIVDGTRAAYQAIVEAPVKIVSGVEGGWLPGEYGVTLHRFDSHRVVENLGLRPADTDGDAARMKSLVHGWVKFDARVDAGSVIWQRP
jgi:hypothetical protein